MADRHLQRKSKYTTDRNIPGAFEGETVTRRRFMNLVTNGAGAVATAAFTLPALGFALAPVFKSEGWSWQAIGPPSDFNETDYVTRVVTVQEGSGESGNPEPPITAERIAATLLAGLDIVIGWSAAPA